MTEAFLATGPLHPAENPQLPCDIQPCLTSQFSPSWPGASCDSSLGWQAKSFESNILPASYCAPRIFMHFPPNPMIPRDRGGKGGTPVSQIEIARNAQ